MQEGKTTLAKVTELYNSLDENVVRHFLIKNTTNEIFIICDNGSTNQSISRLPQIPSYNSTDWGPKRDSLYIVIPITLLYVSIFVTGLLGNVCTCVVIARNKSMHTATNYYLFSLAVSDLLLLISGLPTEIYSTWSKYPYIFGEVFCIIQGFAAETSANATVLTITAFTIERYVAICYPFLSHTMSKLSRAIKYIILIWLLAMCLALPQAMSFGIFYEHAGSLHGIANANSDHYVCTVTRVIIPHAFEISTFVFFVAPMTVITILYILIGIKIHKSTRGRARDGSVRMKHRKGKTLRIYQPKDNPPCLNFIEEKNDKQFTSAHDEEGRKNYSRNSQATKHVVKMLVAVVAAFFICWAPFHAQRLLAIYAKPDSPSMIMIFNVLTYVSGVFYYLSTSINPLLYHIMSHKFRVAFQDTIMLFLRRKSSPIGERCYSALSGRSSQVNSQSNTDSCSQQSSIRYLETEMRRLKDSRRPLVVSFRRKPQPPLQKAKQVTILDAELQKALDSLNEDSNNVTNKKCKFARIKKYSTGDFGNKRKHKTDFEHIELHSLQYLSTAGTEHLSINGALLKTNSQIYRSTEIDSEPINQQHHQQKFNCTKRSYNKLCLNMHSCHECTKSIERNVLTKSSTMPDMNNCTTLI